MYADTMTDSMKKAIDETQRRRTIQEEYNKKHNITPKTINKEIRQLISNNDEEELEKIEKSGNDDIINIDNNRTIEDIEKEMKKAAKELDFERAMQLRDILFELKTK